MKNLQIHKPENCNSCRKVTPIVEIGNETHETKNHVANGELSLNVNPGK